MTLPAIAPVVGYFVGDRKVSYLTADHAGFYICDGRPTSTLSASQKIAAANNGFALYLPNIPTSTVGGGSARTYIYLGV